MVPRARWLAVLMICSMVLGAFGGNLPAVTAQPGDWPGDGQATVAAKQAHPLADSIVIDGVFTGQLLDGDGSFSDGPGDASPPTAAFVELKKFDAADCVFYQDQNKNTWADATDPFWMDVTCNAIFNPTTDMVLLNAPSIGSAGLPLDFLLGVTYLAYNDAELGTNNNRYDNSEDIYFVDNLGEFLGAAERIVYDPLSPDANRVLAHLYILSDAGVTSVHNDFIIDAEAAWVDSNGTAGSGKGQQDSIGLPLFNNAISDTLSVEVFGRWFSQSDNLYWLSTGAFSDTWTPTGDALWLDRDGDGVYSSTVDSFVVDTGETTPGVVGRLIGSDGPDPIYTFVYNDEDYDRVWDDGEDIYTLDGAEPSDWSYFFDRWSWFVDGDGDAAAGRGAESLAALDGNTWFQAADRVFHYDINANHEWNDGEALWIDQDGNGLYNSGIDRMLVMSGTVGAGTVGNLLWVQFVDGDGYATGGDGQEYVPRRGQTPFDLEDNVMWRDVNDAGARFWSEGDGLWLDQDGNDLFNEDVDWVIVRGALEDGALGVRLSPGALHFGYDDGEIALNGRYDPGEDIYAANTFLAYDDFEVAFNGAYDPGEDIYNRAYVEVWVYADGDSLTVPSGVYQPDLEPDFADEGLQVHLNGARIDDPQLAYDTPMGFKAAAGWGPTRGAISDGIFPDNTYNRHYEYQFTAPFGVEGHLFSHWQTSRRGPGRFQGFGTPAMERAETIFQDWVQRTPLPPVAPPLVMNQALLGPILLPNAADIVTVLDPYCWNLSVLNPGDQAVGAIVLTDTLPLGWSGDATVLAPGALYEVADGPGGPVIRFTNGLAPGASASIAICATGPVALAETEVVNRVAGVFDHDANSSTPMIAIPTAAQYLVSGAPIVRQPQIVLAKAALDSEAPADWRATWRLGVINNGYISLDQTSLYDNVPDGLRVRTQNGVAPSGGDVELALGVLPRGQVRIVNLETEVAPDVAPGAVLTNTVTLSAHFSVSRTALLPYGLSASDSVRIVDARELMPESPYVTLSAAEGPAIPDFALRAMLDAYIPTYHSMLFVFTECYGGDLANTFAGRANTAALSAAAPGYCPHYAGYDAAAAAALSPGAGRTSADVHQAGIAGKNAGETPQQVGTPVSLAPSGGAPIESRHVLVYGGKFFGTGDYEEQQRATIVNNFAGASGATVTTVGGSGGAWNYPGTLTGLRGALDTIQEQMNANGQFILFVTGHGDYHPVARAVEIPPRVTASASLTVPAHLVNAMRRTSSNDTTSGVTLFVPGVVTFTPGSLAVRGAFSSTLFTSFSTSRLDVNGDGLYTATGEGTYLFFPVPESALVPGGAGQDMIIDVDVENRTFDTLNFAYVSLDSGSLSKKLPYGTFFPLVSR